MYRLSIRKSDNSKMMSETWLNFADYVWGNFDEELSFGAKTVEDTYTEKITKVLKKEYNADWYLNESVWFTTEEDMAAFILRWS